MPRSEASLRSGDPAAAAAPGSRKALRQHCVAPMLDEQTLPAVRWMRERGRILRPVQWQERKAERGSSGIRAAVSSRTVIGAGRPPALGRCA